MNSPLQPEEVLRADRKTCTAHALALDAAGIRYRLDHRDGEWALIVAGVDADRARLEIEAVTHERHNSPSPGSFAPNVSSGWTGVMGFVVVLVLMAGLEFSEAFGIDWRGTGKTSAGLIREGQIWRAFTALTLHSDIAHLMGNLAIGGLVGLFAGQMLGSGVAWMCILLGGAAGNLMNAWLRNPGHTSVGASTSVFAALGIIAAYSWLHGRPSRSSVLRRVAPVIAAVVLLSMLGTGGERTDVGAHVLGFGAGLLVGIAAGKVNAGFMHSSRAQLAMGGLAVFLLTAAWAAALTFAGAPPGT